MDREDWINDYDGIAKEFPGLKHSEVIRESTKRRIRSLDY